MATDDRPRSGVDLAGPDVRDAIDLGEAVAAVAGEAQAAAVGGDLPAPEDRDRDRVAVPELDGPPVDDDPAVGHWRIRRPCGSWGGSVTSRAGRRRPTTSISSSPGVPSAIAAGTYPSAIDWATKCP